MTFTLFAAARGPFRHRLRLPALGGRTIVETWTNSRRNSGPGRSNPFFRQQEEKGDAKVFFHVRLTFGSAA